MISKLRAIKRIIFSDEKKGGFDCPVCGSNNIKMYPLSTYYLRELHKYQHIHNPFFSETINLEHYSCANCNASDRDRLYALYLKEYFMSFGDQIDLLDIAPANSLRFFIQKFSNVRYRSMDLLMSDVDDKLDITDMHSYKEGQFDFFICSHVLEHIPNDIQAMKELYRILKKGGKGIAMVPINLQVEKTMEDPNCTDIAKRWKYFGQDDHVRMYAKSDFINRLQSVGFTIEQLGIDHFGESVFTKNAIFPTSILYIVTK
jgi:SAM-dependent methyltransferase